MNNEPVAWMYKDEEGGMVSFIKDTLPFDAVPLYTHQYERPHNTVLVPCDKLAEMQAEIEIYKEALEKLARLGNGDNYGNSIGNDIAIDALRKAQEK